MFCIRVLRSGNLALPTAVLVKLWHFVDGLYLWEFLTTLDYEWAVIRGRRPYRWTIWIYSLSRVAGLTSVTLNLISMDVTTPLNCQLWFTSELIACFLSTTAASLLIVLRIIAIWNRNRVVMASALSIWGVYFATLIQVIVRVRSVWIPAESRCVARNIEVTLINIVSTLGIDIVLLIMMLAGMVPLRRHGDSMFSLSRLLWKQGVIWLLLATAVEVPPVVFIVLDLNYPLNIISRVPSLIIMTVAGTRMHRQLVDFASASTDMYDILQLRYFSHSLWAMFQCTR
ncbi:hypothetical protein BC826DRAFT_340283 [Russula brevipes]|nr:hypothetical protein BC826DRAFT_340283 [Russula brevipes]